jgi:hypothetical protein
MKSIDLIMQPHNVKIGDTTPELEPNIKEDCLLVSDGEVIGFYLKQIPDKLKQYVEIANAELLSERVPKSYMERKRPIGTNPNGTIKYEVIRQFSTIIGSCAPKPHMRRPYPMVSSVHNVKSTETFIKAMLLACKESEEIIREIAPSVYEKQEKVIKEKVPPKWRFGRLFTSSISNYNIAANYHRDAANLEGCVNVIIAKRSHAKGGNTTVPDYSATVDSADNSMLVYPAWRNVHGVTPIVPLREGGYRNSLVFYPLKAFSAYW